MSTNAFILAAVLAGCAHGSTNLPEVRIANPVVAGKIEGNKIVHTNKQWESELHVAPGTVDTTATLVQADAQKVCFELRDVEQGKLDLPRSKLELRVDGAPPIAKPTDVTADDGKDTSVDGHHTVEQNTGELKKCRNWSQIDGKCIDTDREKTEDVEKAEHLELMTYVVHACFANPGITSTTKQLMLSTKFYKITNDALDAQNDPTIDMTRHWRWGFGPGDVVPAKCLDLNAGC